MAISKEVRRLDARWGQQTGWPKRLDWVEVKGIRGWTGQRFELPFPIMAVVGENGVGKSTVLQACASVYRWKPPDKKKEVFASEFFPDTAWDQIRDAELKYQVREGNNTVNDSLRKPTTRWRGNQDRRERQVRYFDLRRIQPVPARVGYTRLAAPTWKEVSADTFETTKLARLRGIMGRAYESAKMAVTDGDVNRAVPVIGHQGVRYSGFHQGSGETTIAELLQMDIPPYSLVLIDEVESSLHPRAQRRLIRDLAQRCRELELQVVLTTHSPYVLEELPHEARACILQGAAGGRELIYGVSPDFAMSKMDDLQHAECDLYVEDERAAVMLTEILVRTNASLRQRCQTIPYGAASVGNALGQMVTGRRFLRPTCVFLDGDRGPAPGCLNLPGEDAPERVVFEALSDAKWLRVHERTGRDYTEVVDACSRVMLSHEHHAWITEAASRLFLGSDTLWQAMCAEWANHCVADEEAKALVQAIEDTIEDYSSHGPPPAPPFVEPGNSGGKSPEPSDEAAPAKPAVKPNDPERLFS